MSKVVVSMPTGQEGSPARDVPVTQFFLVSICRVSEGVRAKQGEETSGLGDLRGDSGVLGGRL